MNKLKRIPKGEISFNRQLNEEQKNAKEIILKSKLTLLSGKAGSGKTFLACQIALDQLFTRHCEKIIITRPTVSKEDIGFLPGSLMDKMDPWLQPIYQNMYNLYGKDRVTKYIESGQIEISPLSFLRGQTFTESVILVDEAQNVTNTQMEMIVTRLGINSKMIICGDKAQIDLKKREESGFDFLYNRLKGVEGTCTIELFNNHRDPLVDELIKIYAEK